MFYKTDYLSVFFTINCKAITIVFVICFLLVGCGKESKAVKLCKEFNEEAKKYTSNGIGFEETYSKLVNIYNSYCPDSDNEMCDNVSSITSLNRQNDKDNMARTEIIYITMACQRFIDENS